jgi:hypothetical protein
MKMPTTQDVLGNYRKQGGSKERLLNIMEMKNRPHRIKQRKERKEKAEREHKEKERLEILVNGPKKEKLWKGHHAP